MTAELQENNLLIRLPALENLDVKHSNGLLLVCGRSQTRLFCHRMEIPAGFSDPLVWNDGEVLTIILSRSANKKSYGF